MRAVLLSLLLGISGCVATVRTGPPVFCMELSQPTFECDADYEWLPGYWAYDGWNRRVWVGGRYVPRGPVVRDHRRRR